jgi:hypothetical protein
MWLRKTQPDRPWTELNIQVHPNVSAMFSASVIFVVGDGTATCFWTDRWLHGQSIQDLAPTLFGLGPKRAMNKRTIHEAMEELQWVADIRGSLPIQPLFEFFLIWDILHEFQLTLWRVGSAPVDTVQSGIYSCKSAYERLLWNRLLGVRRGESSCRWEPGTERRKYGGHSGQRSPSSLAPAMCRARMTEVISPLERLLFHDTVIQFTAILYRIGGYTL